VCVCACGVSGNHILWMLVYARVGELCAYTGIGRIRNFRSTTDRIDDGGPIRL
jgi:hypothetical protein